MGKGQDPLLTIQGRSRPADLPFGIRDELATRLIPAAGSLLASDETRFTIPEITRLAYRYADACLQVRLEPE